MKCGKRLSRAFLLKLELAELILGNRLARVEAGSFSKLFPRSLPLVGLGECARVIQVRAGVLRFQCRGLLQMFQRCLRLLLLQKQNSQVQLCEKVIGGKLQGFLLGFYRFIRLVQTVVGKTQVEPGRNHVRLSCDNGF